MKIRVAVFLAGRSLWRVNPLLSLLTVLMLMLVYLNLIYPAALLNGLVAGTNQRLIDTYLGNVSVEPSGGASTITNVGQLQNQIKAVRGVEAVSARNRLSAEVHAGNEFGIWQIDAIDPVKEAQVFKIKPALIEGSYLEPGDSDQILLGIQIAGADRSNLELYTDSLKHVHAGDKVVVKFANGTASGLKKTFTVKGIFREQFIQSDIRAFMTQTELESLFPSSRDQATGLNIKTSKRSETEIVEELSFVHSGLKFTTWQQKAGVIKTMTESFMAINRILGLIALAVAVITIFGVTFIDLARKRHQIAIERAIGIEPATIVLVYLLRAFFFAVTGITLAVTGFVLMVAPYQLRHPFAFPTGDVSLVFNSAFLMRNAALLLAVAVLAALVPAWSAVSGPLIDGLAREQQ